MTGEEERIRELVELMALANGSHEIMALAEELNHLVESRNKRLRAMNSPKGKIPQPESVAPVGKERRAKL